jgi:hypothetical protein
MSLAMLKGDFDPMINSVAELSKYNQLIQCVRMWAPRAPVGSRGRVYVALPHYDVHQYIYSTCLALAEGLYTFAMQA